MVSDEKASLPEIDKQSEIGRNGFLGLTYEYPTKVKGEEIIHEVGIIDLEGQFMAMWIGDNGTHHRIKSKTLEPRETLELAQGDLDAFAEKKKLICFGKTEPLMEVKEEDIPKEKEEEESEPEKMSDKIKRIRARQEEEEKEEKKEEKEKEEKPKTHKTKIKPGVKNIEIPMGYGDCEPGEPDAPMLDQKEEKQTDIKKPHSYYKGYKLIKKKDFPSDLLGGLLEDVVVERNESANLLFAHAVSKEANDEHSARKAFSDYLNKLTGIEWTWVINKLYNADTKQLNANRQKEE